MNALHAAAWPAFAIGLAGMAAVAAVAAVRGRGPEPLDWLRRAALVLLVSQASVGLALAVRGAAPGELLHWIYGGLIVVALLVPATLPPQTSGATRSWALAAASAVGVVLVWRLWASG